MEPSDTAGEQLEGGLHSAHKMLVLSHVDCEYSYGFLGAGHVNFLSETHVKRDDTQRDDATANGSATKGKEAITATTLSVPAVSLGVKTHRFDRTNACIGTQLSQKHAYLPCEPLRSVPLQLRLFLTAGSLV